VTAPAGGQRCPGCGEHQAAPCAFCGQLQDPACGYGTTHEPPAAQAPGRWRCLECGATAADDPDVAAALPAGAIP
jgi:hypothetical protein